MKSILKIFIVLIAILSNSMPCFSQSAVDLPAVVPPPADAAALGRYGDIPVNMSSGLPSINVPLYEIKTPRLSVPITLNYFASGIKVDDQASWVGLGWSLNAGGVITRTIKGRDDLNSFAYPEYAANLPLADTLSSADWDYENNVSLGRTDVEPDNFFYNFSTYSGKYVFGQNGQPLIINYHDPIQILYDTLSQTFTVLDPKGNQYLFATIENANSYSTSAGDFPSHNMTYISSWYLTRIVSFDKSDTISFQYYTDTPLYQTFNSYSEGLGPTYVCSNDGTSENQGIIHDGNDIIQSESFLNSSPERLKEIDFKNGKVAFFSSGPRTDNGEAKLDSIVMYNYNQASATYNVLKTIYLSYDYFFSTFPAQGIVPAASGYRLRLDSVQTAGNDGADGGKYKFLYDSTMLPVIGSNARDLFNFYNGAIANPTLVPAQTYLYAGSQFNIGGADRSANASSIQAGVLKHIYYPTGGRTDFTYEPNSFSEDQYNTVNQQIICEAVGIGKGDIQMGVFGQTDTVLFTATNSTSNSYIVYVSPYNYRNVQKRPFVSFVDLTANQTIYLNGATDPVNGLSETLTFGPVIGHTYQLIADAYDTSKVTASIVLNNYVTDTTVATELGGGLRVKQITDFDNTGRFARSDVYKYGTNESGYGYLPSAYYQFNTFSLAESFYLGCNSQSLPNGCDGINYSRVIFNSSSIYDVFNLTSSAFSYPEVAKYQMDSLGNILGKSVYDYSLVHDGVLPVPGNNLTGSTYVTNSYQDALLLAQTDYAYQSGQFSPVKKTISNYTSLPLAQGRGCKIGTGASISGCYTPGPTGNIGFYAFDYPIYTGLSLLTSQTVYDYDQKDTSKYVESTKNYTYDNLTHLQPTLIQDTLSDGSVQRVVNRYPAEVDSINGLSATEVAAVDSLQSRHNITTLVQSQTTRDGQPVKLLRTDYKVWPNNLVLEDSVELQNGNFPIENRMQFYNYDALGNILQDAKTADMNHSYIWDYQRAYPIAQVVNAAQSDIAYTSFEADGSGNWSLSGGTVDNTQAITGTSSYQNGTLTRSGLNPATTYIVSYWSQNGAYSIPGTITGYPVQGKTVSFHTPGWTLYVHKVAGESTITVNATGHIDELRLYPATAQMTTYTYDPLVGMTTKMDAGSRATYYEYDGLQRLKRVRDQDYNILKTIDYAYQAPAGCGSGCYSIAMQTFAGTNTLSYPVGVFDVNGNLLGNATNAAGYVGLWNNDTADSRVGTLSPGQDSMHFNIAVNAGQTLPASVTGCRYYQFDLSWNVIDGIRNFNGAYVDFGDGTGMRLGKTYTDTPKLIAPNTTYALGGYHDWVHDIFNSQIYFIHTYPDTTLKTITLYHNDDTANSDLDNINVPATSLTLLTNLRGNLPQNTLWFGGSSYEQASVLTTAGITNWNSITSAVTFNLQDGGDEPVNHVAYAQDFMKNNKGLLRLTPLGCADTSFRISRLKSDWNTYFTQINDMEFSDGQWNREDLSALTNLFFFKFYSSSTNGAGVIDSIINQISAGAGHHRTNGIIVITWPGYDRTSASADGYAFLKSQNWIIYINGVFE